MNVVYWLLYKAPGLAHQLIAGGGVKAIPGLVRNGLSAGKDGTDIRKNVVETQLAEHSLQEKKSLIYKPSPTDLQDFKSSLQERIETNAKGYRNFSLIVGFILLGAIASTRAGTTAAHLALTSPAVVVCLIALYLFLMSQDERLPE